MGKGEGKGGCLEQVCDAIQAGIACLCCLLLTGPVLIIVGTILLVQTGNDKRSQRVEQFNELTAVWNSYGYQDFSTDTAFSTQVSYSGCGSSDGQTFSRQALIGGPTQDDIGTDDKRVSFDQWKYSQQLNQGLQSIDGCQVSIQVFRQDGTNGSQVSTSIGTMTGTVYRRTSRNVCTSSRERDSSCRRRCNSKYDGSYSGRLCTYTTLLKNLCIKVDESGEGERDWTENNQLPGPGVGCFWDKGQNRFDQQKYENSNNFGNIEISVRSARDPYLNFQYVTDGSGTFGLTAGQKIVIGLACLVVGILFIGFWVLTIYCCCKLFNSRHSEQAAPTNPIGNFYYSAFNRYGNYIPGYQAQPPPPQPPYQPLYRAQPQYGQPQYGAQPQYGYAQDQSSGASHAGYPTKDGVYTYT